MVSIADVADRAGVSQTSVSHTLSGKHVVRPAAQRRVRAASVELGYSPHRAAQNLASGRTREHAFGMAWEKDGISKRTAMRTIAAVADEFDLVGLTVAEFVPREAIVLRSILSNLPLGAAVSKPTPGSAD